MAGGSAMIAVTVGSGFGRAPFDVLLPLVCSVCRRLDEPSCEFVLVVAGLVDGYLDVLQDPWDERGVAAPRIDGLLTSTTPPPSRHPRRNATTTPCRSRAGVVAPTAWRSWPAPSEATTVLRHPSQSDAGPRART